MEYPDSTIQDRAVLLPQPRSFQSAAGLCQTGGFRTIQASGTVPGLALAAAKLQTAAQDYAGVAWGIREKADAKAVILALDPGAAPHPEGYRLTLDPKGIHVQGHDPAGVFYGAMTLIQLLRQFGGALPCGIIEDHPDFPVRGVLLDISRDKVPTMETLFALVDRFAEWKLNHLELYTEHTFAYSRHQAVWEHADPMTGAQIQQLDAYCRERHVELAPNQNSFGHMARWLVHPAYRDLAECPDGFNYPWGTRSPLPNSLNPADPRSLALIAGLCEELLPNFTSHTFNVGCDETWDLGQGKCRELCQQKGKGRVYLDFLLKIYDLTKRHGRTMLFWGDIVIKHPELISELPRDIVVLEWGYEAEHPFAEHGVQFGASGIPFWVCPGTSSWNSFAGRTDNCLANLHSAAENGLKNGARGFLITDWGDNGHWQPLPVSYLGFAAGAALAWYFSGNRDRDWASVLDIQVFEDEARVMGGVACDLGNVYLESGAVMANATIPFRLLNEAPTWVIPPTVTGETLAATRDRVVEVAGRIGAARMRGPEAGLVADEFKHAAHLLAAGCDRGLYRLSAPAALPPEILSHEMTMCLIEHRRLWLARSRPGGLGDSEKNLEQRLKEYDVCPPPTIYPRMKP